MSRITPHQIALGVGVSGAMVDVSSYASFGIGVANSWGRQDEFRDAGPRAFSFTLDNYDGRFTPGNTNSALATLVTEGTKVSWLLGTRLVSGTVSAFALGADESSWGTITLSCDDMLGNAARRQMTGLAEGSTLGSTPYLYWPLNDAVGSLVAAETSGNLQPALTVPGVVTSGVVAPGALPVFGVAGVAATGVTQIEMDSTAATSFIFTAAGTFATVPYSGTSMGFWSCWITASSGRVQSSVNVYIAGLVSPISFGVSLGSYFLQPGNGNTPGYGATVTPSVPAYVSIGVSLVNTTMTVTLYVNGVSVLSLPYYDNFGGGSTVTLATNASKTPSSVSLQSGDGVTAAYSAFSHLSHTATMPLEMYAGVTTEANRLALIASTTPEITLAAVPSDLSTALLGVSSAATTALSAFTDVLRTEQGSIYTVTSGTLLAPVQTITIRARQRPAVATWSFDATTDLQGVVPFVRDITNMVASATITGPAATVTVVDSTVTGRVGSANASEQILNVAAVDLAMFGQDRLNRGKNANLRITSITIDALVTTADRSAALLAMVPGDRVSIVNLPTATLGFTSWDGWLLGVSEIHTILTHTFQLFLQPVLLPTAIFDTNLFMAGTSLSLAAALTASATTMSVSTVDALLETVAVPYTLIIDSEQVTVTACTTATPQVATITRGVNSTTAAAHSAGASLDAATSSLYAF